MLKVIKRSMKLASLPKTSSFTESLRPDSKVPTTTDALNNENNIIHTPRILEDGAFTYALPEARKTYKYLTSSETALKDLGLDPQQVTDPTYQDIVSGKFYQDPDFVNQAPFPYSQAYAGWQFGQFAGQLGDGRVVNLFEVEKQPTDSKLRNKYEIQLKGAGLTPYSRFADGKAVLRSSIREYIISEHLNAIGINTTRALALTYLPDTLARRYLPEKCAIVARFAELWIRLGTFDLYRWRGDRTGIKQLSDYCIKELFTVDGVKFPLLTELLEQDKKFFNDFDDELSDYDKLYFEVVLRNSLSTAKWQTYGFLNGVLNTDNTSILGLSMDYGPFSIMDKFKPSYTPNSEDHEGRYDYRNTPTAIWWNLTRFGENMAELIGTGNRPITNATTEQEIINRATKIIEIASEIYTHSFTLKYVESFFKRLGLSTALINRVDPDEQNQELIAPLLTMLEKVQCDFNMFFVNLQDAQFTSENMDFKKLSLFLKPDEHELFDEDDLVQLISGWLPIYQKYLSKSEELGWDRASSKAYNPLFLPRNWILDEVIQGAESSNADDISLLKKVEKMSFNPFDKSKWGDELKDVEERWMIQGDRDERYSMLQCSCSS